MPPAEMTPVADPVGNLISPTTMTHSIPRPKSPRRPDYRSGGGVGLLSAESFQRTYESKIPSIRRRSHQEMGSFGGGGCGGANAGEKQQQPQQTSQRQPQHQNHQP